MRKRRSGGPLTGTSGNNGEGTVKSGKERERERGKLETTKIPRVLPQSRPRFMNFTLPLLCDYCKKGHRGAGATFSPRARSTFELARSRREDEILNSLSPLRTPLFGPVPSLPVRDRYQEVNYVKYQAMRGKKKSMRLVYHRATSWSNEERGTPEWQTEPPPVMHSHFLRTNFLRCCWINVALCFDD